MLRIHFQTTRLSGDLLQKQKIDELKVFNHQNYTL